MKIWLQTPFDNMPYEGFRRERYSLMAEAFADAGHEVEVFTADFNHGTKSRRRRAAAGFASPAIRVHEIETRPYSRNTSTARVFSHLAYARRLAEAFRSAGRPDAVISAVPTLCAASASLRYARGCGAKFIADVQDAWPEAFAGLLPRCLRWMHPALFAPLRFKARSIYRSADLVTGVSGRYGEIAGRVDYYVAPLGISVREPAVRKTEGVRDGPVRLVYAGNLGPSYDLGTVMDAVAKNSDFVLNIAGAGPQEHFLRSMAAGLGDRVRFHGYLDEGSLGRLLADCDIGIVPMRDASWVGLPNKVYDYLAAGLPVASSLKGECGALLAGEKLGEVYDEGDARSFADAVRRIPRQRVALPDSLRAERIYPAYVRRIESLFRN